MIAYETPSAEPPNILNMNVSKPKQTPNTNLPLRDEWGMYDARKKYQIPKMEGRANPACRCGDVLQGKCKPSDCKVFGKVCTPQHPVGACMVSGEGACSAYYMYGRA